MKRLLPALILAVSLPAWSATATRVSSFEYDPVTGLLTKETIEPDQPQYRLDTVYTHDAFGNRKTATVSSPATGTAAIVARTSTTSYDANGQFPITTSNALGHSESKTFDARFGTVAGLTGPNGLATTWQYDGFGRKTRESRADGSYTQWTYDFCDAACPANGAYRVVTQVFGAGAQLAPVSVVYFDSLNRKLRTAVQAFDGRWVYTDTVYNNQGRIEKVSRAYFAGQAIYWVTSKYDELGRVVKVFEPDDRDNPALIATYNGLVTSRINRKGQTTTETRNVLGQNVAVTDALGQMTAYAYDAFGNLATVTAPGNIVTRNVYDVRGRKTQTSDPDLGAWKYEYNALGELTKQTDAKNQITTLTYDKLGRMTRRVEPGLTSDWIYDSAAYGKGKLHQAKTSAGFIRTHYYDNKGRPSQTVNNMGAGNPLLMSAVTYDAAGRAATSTYPNGLVLKQVYNAFGYQIEVRNNASNALYWQANAMDAEGHFTRETAGNGVVTERGYDPVNGRLQNITGYKGSTQIQGHAYVYDTIGNVTILADGPGSQLEIRGGYDMLNRLTKTDITINGVTTPQNLAYDALGNIASKTGVGSYAYGDPLHKHAVTGVTGGPVTLNYAYDANGNLTSGAGRSIAWTAWNMLSSITSGGTTQSWLYGPEHDRYKLIASGRTTWYLNPGVHTGGHYERTQYASGTIEHRVTLYGGGKAIGEVLTFEVTSGTTPSAQTRYFHSDAQGSIAAVTNEAGVVLTRFRYDPWGKQTLAFGNNTGISQTRQGHTAHEMLDSGLTHMNGRVYDPHLSRFVSADPYVDNPFDLQSLNRYSYVWNNPMGYSDPSGYFGFGLGDVMKASDKLAGIGLALAGDPISGYAGYKALSGPYGYQIKSAAIGVASMYCGGGAAACNAAGQALLAAAYGASNSQVLRAGVAGYFSVRLNTLAGDIGQVYGNYGIAHFAAHAFAGCISSAAGGGNCGSGALSGVGGLAGTYATSGLSSQYQFIGTSVAGGTVSVIGGGKFANGAVTGAFGYLFNFMMHRDARINKNLGQRYSLDLYDPMGEFYLQEAKPLFKRFTGWVGRVLGVAELGVDRIVPSVGTQEIDGYSNRREAARLDESIGVIARDLGYQTGKSGLSASQAETLMRTIDQRLPEFRERYGESAQDMLNRLNAK